MSDDTVNNRENLEKYLGVKDKPGICDTALLEKVAKYTPIFQKIPGISCICICNSLAMNASHKGSDIDLFIITRKNRLWTARVFATLLLGILRQRKTAKQHAGKFCLSFFITEDAMNLKDIAIKNDIYLSYWIETLKPIINRNRCYQKFMQKNTPLSGILSPLEEKGAQGNESLLYSGREEIQRGVITGKLGNLLELILKTLFLPRTKKSFQKLGKPSGVIISDTILKFHDQDKRERIRDTIFN